MDKEKLFQPRAETSSGFPEDDVEVPGLGTFRVRGLSRAEAMIVANAGDAAAMERKTIHFGLVDPKLTEAEVGRWQKIALAGELQVVNQRIVELSGMLEDAPKSGLQGVPRKS